MGGLLAGVTVVACVVYALYMLIYGIRLLDRAFVNNDEVRRILIVAGVNVIEPFITTIVFITRGLFIGFFMDYIDVMYIAMFISMTLLLILLPILKVHYRTPGFAKLNLACFLIGLARIAPLVLFIPITNMFPIDVFQRIALLTLVTGTLILILGFIFIRRTVNKMFFN